MNASGTKLVISQPAAALCIQVPIFETTVAAQSTAKAGWENGAKDERALSAGEAEPRSLPFSVLMHLPPLPGFGPFVRRTSGRQLTALAAKGILRARSV